MKRPLLHAERLTLVHPKTAKRLSFKAPWPNDFKAAERAFRKAFAVGLVVLSAAGVVRAETKSGGTPKSSSTKHSTTSSGTSSAYRRLKSEVADLREELSGVQNQMAALQKNIDDAGISGRLRDLEKAVSELNGKSVAEHNATEETKTQVLDVGRRMKSLQETVGQMRDQMDRLQQSVILRKAQTENNETAVDAGKSTKTP